MDALPGHPREASAPHDDGVRRSAPVGRVNPAIWSHARVGSTSVKPGSGKIRGEWGRGGAHLRWIREGGRPVRK